ncbi:hypothetical protein H2203_005410 [Taxawa tesnikishii (nom. ined.)]|nr:hypothetical protein H2203_005410 [Dothideales sp. JES 119]
MNPADLHHSDSLPLLDGTPTLSSKTLPIPSSASARVGKSTSVNPRIDVEPIYTQLRAALGEQFNNYRAAVSQFVQGKLNQRELHRLITPLLSSAPSVAVPASSTSPALASTLHLHNSLITAIYANIHRDPPPEPIAPFVLATDAPSSLHGVKSSAAGAGDKADERLKREVMALAVRDRRRIKAVKDEPGVIRTTAGGLAEMQEYHQILAARGVDSDTATAGQNGSGLSKTNFDLEIRRQYAMPLAGETLEFPSRGDIQSRIEPICYRTGVNNGVAQGQLGTIAELVETAVETFIKEELGKLLASTRINGEGCVQTARFRRQLAREEEAAERGEVPLSLDDLRLVTRLNGGRWIDNFAKERMMLNEGLDMPWHDDEQGMVNGTLPTLDLRPNLKAPPDDAMDIDLEDYGWVGGSAADRDALNSVLDSALDVMP